MNLDLIRPKPETEDFLLSKTKNCETLIKKTLRKTEETLEFKFTKPLETFYSKPPISIEGSWMIGLTSFEASNFIFHITEENIKFDIDIFPDSKKVAITYEKVRDEIEKDMVFSDITAADIQDEILGPIIIEERGEEISGRMEDREYMNILAGYTRSIIQDFEGCIRTETDLVEDDIRLVLDKFNSSVISYELLPGNLHVRRFFRSCFKESSFRM